MSRTQITTSAALYYKSRKHDAIPLEWYERAIEFFGEHSLSPIYFTAGGGPFELEDCYELADGAGKSYRWGDPKPVARCRAELIGALQANLIYSLSLDAPRVNGMDRQDWRADASLSSIGGDLYLGIDEELLSDPVAVLRRAWHMAHGLIDIRYGFAYRMPLKELPDCYANGMRGSTLADFQQLLRDRHEAVRRPRMPDDLWSNELSDGRRHLTGHFRGVYVANLLSDSHMQAADLPAQQIGRLSPLENGLWLWELSESELPQAHALLAARRAPVSRASA